jgi:transcriptional regulator with XRE-family HTH domain
MTGSLNTFRVRRSSGADTNRRYVSNTARRQTVEMAGKKTDEALRCGQRIRVAMESKGWTQAELARQSGLQPSRVGNYLQGLRELGIRESLSLAHVLKVPAAYLLGVVDDLDRDVLMTTAEQKHGFLALLGQQKDGRGLDARALKRSRAI